MCRKGNNIYKRKDGRWEGRYIKGRKLDGSIKYGYIYRKSYEETKRVLDMYKEFYRPQKTATRPQIELSFSEWKEIWLQRIKHKVKATTFSNYSYKLQQYITPYFKHYLLHEVSEEVIYEFIENLRTHKLSTNSIHSIFQLFKYCFKEALISIRSDYKFLDEIKLPKREYRKVSALTLLEQRKLTAVAKKEAVVKGLPVILALHTGMRIGEIAAIEWADIDFSKNVIHVNKTCQRIFQRNSETAKTCVHIDTAKSQSSNRIIPMTPLIKKLLQQNFKKRTQTKWVFSIKNKPCEPRLITSYFHSIREKANLTQVHFHQLRHTFATRCLEALSDIPTVSALLGHRSTQLTLDVYSDVLMEQRVQTIQNVAKYVS